MQYPKKALCTHLSRISLGCLLTLMGSQLIAAEIEFNAPTGGWRNDKNNGSTYTQSVNYPASSVNTANGTQTGFLIKGKIKDHQKNSKPHTLIVNGTAMPQHIENDGSFSRPYAFAQGSNSVEMRSPDGKTSKQVQFYDTSSGTRPKLRVFLSWSTNHTDLDLHVVTPDGKHAYYADRVLPNGGALDVDVTTGYGPEIFSMPTPLTGTYLVYLNYYGGNQDDKKDTITVADITILTNEGTANEKKQTFKVPMRKAGELTLVKSFQYP